MQVSLEPEFADQDKQAPTLGEQIQRITISRGSFAKLTEEGLQDEIQKSQAPSPAPEPKEEPKDLFNFEQQRQLISQSIKAALNESALSLDCVSLLISAVRPQAGASSMSPMLNKHIPLATLSADTLTSSTDANTGATAAGAEKAGAGWKLTTLKGARDNLASAAERLEKECQNGKRFYAAVNRVCVAGEVLTKAPRSAGPAADRRLIQVKYGFGDVGSTYVDKGIGELIKGPAGECLFKPQTAPSGKVVRVTLYSETGEYQSESQFFLEDLEEGNVLQNISHARLHVFEDELFFHLIHEARQLAGHRVVIAENKVVCHLPTHTIEIDHFGGRETKIDEISEIGDNKNLATVICNTFRLLLLDHFSKSLRRMRSPPESLNSRESSKAKTPSLLAPVLARIQHNVSVARLKRLLELMARSPSFEDEQDQNPPTTESDLLESFLEPPESLVTLSKPVRMVIKVSTSLKLNASTYEVVSAPHPTSFADLSELELWLKHFWQV